MKRKISTPLTITFIVVILIIVVAVISQFFNTVHFYFNLAGQSQAIVVDNSPKRLENPPKDIKAIYLTAYTANNDKRMTEIIDLINNNGEITICKIQCILKREQVDISMGKIYNKLLENNICHKKTISKSLLTDIQKETRLKLAIKYQHFDWNNVVFFR